MKEIKLFKKGTCELCIKNNDDVTEKFVKYLKRKDKYFCDYHFKMIKEIYEEMDMESDEEFFRDY